MQFRKYLEKVMISLSGISIIAYYIEEQCEKAVHKIKEQRAKIQIPRKFWRSVIPVTP